MEKKGLPHKLKPLIEKLFEGENISWILKKEENQILDQCTKKIIKIRSCQKPAKEQMTFLKEINYEKTQVERDRLKDSDYTQQIKELTHLRVLIIKIVDYFLKADKKRSDKQIKYDIRSIVGELFARASQNLNEQENIIKINSICFAMYGWLKGDQYKMFSQQMRDLRKQNEQLKGKIADFQENKQSIEQIKRRFQEETIRCYETIAQQSQRLKTYESQQIFQANDSQSQDGYSGSIPGEFISLKMQDREPNQSKQTQTDKNHIWSLTMLSIKVQPVLKIDQQIEAFEIESFETQIQTQKSNVAIFEVQTESYQPNTQEIQTQTNQYVYASQEIQTQYFEQLQEKYVSIQKLRLKQLFYGQLFYDGEVYKERLIKILQQMNKTRIRRTRLLYRYDPLSPTNFHQYIDKVKGLVFVVKTTSGLYLSGFYSGQLEPDKTLNQFGLLISLTNNQSFVLKEETGKIRTMIYDSYYVIFGNAELRIRFGEPMVFSNFGIMNSYFDPRGKKIGDFLGEGNNIHEVKCESYEFHQVLFKTES